jgi:ubiquinone/menaquinone biosynthesis C-methylase UbiE
MRVLDVACGTGVLTLAAADLVKPDGSVVGLDLNPGMLEVAMRKGSPIDWREASADAIPFEDATFDAVVSQFGLMFFPDKPRAIQEMLRVLRPGGSLAIAVWDSLENNAGYAAINQLLIRLFGDSAAESLTAPYSLGDVPELSSLFADAGASNTKITTIEGKARFSSIRHWMEADIRGWTLADAIDDAEFERLVSEAEAELAHLVTESGSVEFGNPAHIVTATRHAG